MYPPAPERRGKRLLRAFAAYPAAEHDASISAAVKKKGSLNVFSSDGFSVCGQKGQCRKI